MDLYRGGFVFNQTFVMVEYNRFYKPGICE